jgi:hypothetical protein
LNSIEFDRQNGFLEVKEEKTAIGKKVAKQKKKYLLPKIGLLDGQSF